MRLRAPVTIALQALSLVEKGRAGGPHSLLHTTLEGPTEDVNGKVDVRASSHTRLKALDHGNVRALVGRKGGDRPSSLHTRR